MNKIKKYIKTLYIILLITFLVVIQNRNDHSLTLDTKENSLEKCSDEVFNPKLVQTPLEAKTKLVEYVESQLSNKIESISNESILARAPWRTVGWHKCYFEDKTVESGYAGFLPIGVDIGYTTAIELKFEQFSGGFTMFLSYAIVEKEWVVLSAGTSP